MTTVSQAVSVGIADVEKAFKALEADFNAKKSELEAIVTSHIGSHQAQAAAHTAEVQAATGILNLIHPQTAGSTVNAAQAAQLVLTANKAAGTVWEDIKVLWDRGWRWLVIGGAGLYIVHAIHAGLIK